MNQHDDALVDYKYFFNTHPKEPNSFEATRLIYFEIHLLIYRTRLYSNINLHIVQHLLPFAQINNIIEPLYLHKPTLFFHAIYTNYVPLIKLFLYHNPKHYINNHYYYPAYSLLTALHTKHLPTIKTLIPYTNIHFNIDNTTPYNYVISNFEISHPIYLLFEYLHLHSYSIKLLIHSTNLTIDIIKHIQTYLI